MNFLYLLLVFVPISIVGHFMGFSETAMFILSALGIVPLAGVMGTATEGVSHYAGSRIGGFLNATFGNATELIIGIIGLKAGLFEVVKSSIAGSVIGNILLVLGLSMFCGGLKYKTQTFNKNAVRLTSSMLLFAVVCLTIPAIFTHTLSDKTLTTKYEGINVLVAIILLIIYICQIIFTFFTHKDVLATEEAEENDGEVEEPKWNLKISILMLVLSTVFIAIMSEFFVGAVEPMTEQVGLPVTFVGIILVPIIGNAAEHSTAIIMALKNKMSVSMEIALGSSLQIILFVAPVLILLSLLWKPMSVVFTPFELVALFSSVIIANKLVDDGKSNWLEGFVLVATYVILGAMFFIV
ncbi:MAG: calcium/proton exchanger [Lachnospiraceae bacterium]|nr:calcium/proton exchanger [Lachnospiraceae bacterium]